MSRLPTLSPLALQCKSGSIQSSNAPLVNRPVVEVSEDSSCDDVDHDCRINNSDDTKKRRRMTTTTRKQRKARRNSTPSLNRRTAEISQSCHSLPSKIHPSQSYPGPKNSDMHCCNYRSSECEYSLDGTSTTNESITIASVTSRGVTCPFPWKLHDMLKYCCPQNGLESSSEPPIVIWNPTGTAFAVLDVNRFVQAILPRYVPLCRFKINHDAFGTSHLTIYVVYCCSTIKILCTEQVCILSTTVKLVWLYTYISTMQPKG